MLLTAVNAPVEATRFIDAIPPFPSETFDGQGIVVCGGGIKYGACAYVLVRLLRYLGCDLPIEVWCLNDDEFDPSWIELVKPYDVECVNAAEVLKSHPHRKLGGWELKPYAILHSRFREILFLDADNVPVVDPSFLFNTPQYTQTGTLFWPDPEDVQTAVTNSAWDVFDVPYCDCPDQESGQLLIDKSRCWSALNLCNYFNEHSNFYYQFVYGDKDTFRFAWQRMNQPICWPEKFASGEIPFVLLQHDFEGNVLFQHRYFHKWSFYGDNTSIPRFHHQEICLQFLQKLRETWQPQHHLMRNISRSDRESINRLTGRRFIYERFGHNRWEIQLGENAMIEDGYNPSAYLWWIEDGSLALAGINGKQKLLCSRNSGEVWEAVQQHGLHKIKIQVRPLENGPLQSEATNEIMGVV